MLSTTQAKLRLMALVSLLVTATSANALLFTDTKSFNNSNVKAQAGYTTNNNVSDTSSRTKSTYLAGFDSSLGTLNSVKITFNTTSRLWGKLDVYDPSTCLIFCEDNVKGAGHVYSTNRIDLVNPNLGGIPANYENKHLGCSDNDGSCFDTEVVYDYNFDGTLFSTSNASLLSAFINSTVRVDTYNYTRALVENCYDDEDRCRTQSDSDFWGSLSVIYDYTAPVITPTPGPTVPEPGVLGLLGLGLLSLGFARKK